MYEHFLTDLAGHAQDMANAVEVLENLEGFLDALLMHVDHSKNLVLLTSDHGNLEDLSVKTHTRNPVPTLLWGTGAAAAASGIRNLSDIAPAILRHWGGILKRKLSEALTRVSCASCSCSHCSSLRVCLALASFFLSDARLRRGP
jgi:bisphosphoglycerate-independent phosphoglycerate mutase (AlkP superfamily)